MPQWDPGTYLKFANERTQPAIDLINRIEIPGPARIIDLGCGPGTSTEALRRRWPESRILGLDRSPEMVEAARRTYPDWQFELGDAAHWTASEPFDLVFSNALLQWVPDHAALCPRLLEQVASGGALAAQMPALYDSPLHRQILEVSAESSWDSRMHAARAAAIRLPPAFYYDVLSSAAKRLDLWETTYYHVLAGLEAILEWVRGTGLRPFLEALASDDERQRFEQLLLARFKETYPRRADSRVLFPFRRLFFVAYR